MLSSNIEIMGVCSSSECSTTPTNEVEVSDGLAKLRGSLTEPEKVGALSDDATDHINLSY